MDYWKRKQKPNQAIGKPVLKRNQEVIEQVLEDVPHDGLDHTVEMRVRREGYGLIIRNRGLKVDGESVGSD
jgi:hypothetical protein